MLFIVLVCHCALALTFVAASATTATTSTPSATPSPIFGALPFHRASGHGDAAVFTVKSSPRFHNRPLYGPHNGALIIAGDKPIVHLGNDTSLFGGFLLGFERGAVGVWAHNASEINATYEAGAESWVVRDSSLPGLTLHARVMPSVSGFGFVFDANVTDDGTSGLPTQVIWAFGCATHAAAGNALGWQLDPLLNTDTLSWAFSPSDCKHNNVSLGTDGASFTIQTLDVGDVSVRLTPSGSPTTTTVGVSNASDWENISLLASAAPALPPTPKKRQLLSPSSILPVSGASLWLRASTLASTLPDGAAVTAWPDESGSGAVLIQSNVSAQPKLLHSGLGSAGDASVLFDGAYHYLYSDTPSVGLTSSIFVILRDDGSSGGSGGCCSGVIVFGPTAANGSCNGISTLPSMKETDDDDDAPSTRGHPIVTKLDYAGSDANGHYNILGRPVIAASIYAANESFSLVDGCVQSSRAPLGRGGNGVFVGTRFAELSRFFKGAIAEIVVFDRDLNVSEVSLMDSYFSLTHPSLKPRRGGCEAVADYPLGVGRVGIGAGASTTRLTWAVVAGDAAMVPEPQAALIAATARVTKLTRSTSITPDSLIDAALRAAGPAVDGLFRDSWGCFVHGAMAWDVLYVGWRSEYGATCLGWRDLVESEGRFFLSHQDNSSDSKASCLSDAAHLLTVEAPSSRFYGRGKITEAAGMYDMQTQFFDQQIHSWRWGGGEGGEVFEAALRVALTLHAEWASAVFDADGNGLFSSYINTWPTDSQWYNGAETVEETAYMYRVQLALRDLALRSGDAAAAATANAAATQISDAFSALWLSGSGHPAAGIEEGGHRRLRPDAWLYSIFLPIEASLLTFEQVAQALHYSEWGLERLGVSCDDSNINVTCAEVCVTSNWVPSMWSVRQLWSGDNYALALAYAFAGMGDEMFKILKGTLSRDMLQSAIPGQAGGPNGGTDFNDAVHPMARALIEGLFGYRPDYPNNIVVIAPTLPSTWANFSFFGADVTLDFFAQLGSVQLSVTLTRPVELLEVRIPLLADAGMCAIQTLGDVIINGAPQHSTWTSRIEANWGQPLLIVRITAAGTFLISNISISQTTLGAIPCGDLSSIYANTTEGLSLTLALPSSRNITLFNFSDPQSIFVEGSAEITESGIIGNVANGTKGVHAVIGYSQTSGGLPFATIFKITIAPSAPPPLPPPTPLPSATWAFIPITPNADVTQIYKPNTYLSPRPQTCGVRIGTDGYSAWSFTYWGTKTPIVDLSNVANITVSTGVIKTSQGARFLFSDEPAGGANIQFASLWDNYPAVTNVSIPTTSLPGATISYVLVAGSTNPMQTLLPNAVLRFYYDDSTFDMIELIPPHNFWSLSIWGVDYDIINDRFTMPNGEPPDVRLGNNCRAMVYAQVIPEGRVLLNVELEVLSQEVVIGLIAVSLAK